MSAYSVSSLRLVDVHTHCGGINLFNFGGKRVPATHSVRELCQSIADAGVSRAVTFPISTPRSAFVSGTIAGELPNTFPFELENAQLLEEVRYYQAEDRIMPFCAIDPIHDIDRQIEFLSVNRSRIFGVKLHTRTMGVPATSLISKFGAALIELDLPLIVHTKISPDCAHPRHGVELARELPELRVCLAHMVALDDLVITEVEDLANCWVDCSPLRTIQALATRGNSDQLSSNLADLDYGTPPSLLRSLAERLPTSLLWGTDEPFTSSHQRNHIAYTQHVEDFRSAFDNEDDQFRFGYGNAVAWLRSI